MIEAEYAKGIEINYTIMKIVYFGGWGGVYFVKQSAGHEKK